jgi:hypothetical protein
VEISGLWKTENAGLGMGKKEIFLTLWVIPPATRLDWVLMGEPCEGIDVTLEATPQKVKGRREVLNLECSINYDA